MVKRSPRAYLIDFDGTITTIDTLQYLLDQYGMPDWRSLDQQVEAGILREVDVMKIEMLSLRVTLEDAIAECIRVIPLRDGVREFLSESRAAGHRSQIVSAGYRELIEAYLANWAIDCEVVANSLPGYDISGGWLLKRPFDNLTDCRQSLCKCVPLHQERTRGREIVYIGDGITDFCAAANSDRVYAVTGSALERRLLADGKPYTSFNSFSEILTREF